MNSTAVAIGNFDGVHLGHRALLTETIRYANEHGLDPVALTFDPHPTTVVAPNRVPKLLSSIEERKRLLHEVGMERVVVLHFTPEIAALSPREFVTRILVNDLKTRAVFVGENFRFGAKKQGSPEALMELGQELHFVPNFLAPVKCRGQVVSSTAIRRYLEEGRIGWANRLLGRCFTVSGAVVSGHGIGRRETVPTLNLEPRPEQLVPRGVFVTETMDLENGRRWQSITNVGTRPTFNGDNLTIETFLLNPFSPPQPVQISVAFRRFVRHEKSFPDPATLRAQILRDVGRAQAYWRRLTRLSRAVASIY